MIPLVVVSGFDPTPKRSGGMKPPLADGKAQSHFDHPLHSPIAWLEAAQWWPQCFERCRPILDHGDSAGLYLAGSVLHSSRAQ